MKYTYILVYIGQEMIHSYRFHSVNFIIFQASFYDELSSKNVN